MGCLLIATSLVNVLRVVCFQGLLGVWLVCSECVCWFCIDLLLSGFVCVFAEIVFGFDLITFGFC